MPWHQWRKGRLVGRLVRKSQRAHGAAVEAICKGHQLVRRSGLGDAGGGGAEGAVVGGNHPC
jgi:hypothetical protein